LKKQRDTVRLAVRKYRGHPALLMWGSGNEVDAVCYAWSGKWPSNRSPKITRFESPLKEATIAPGLTTTATGEAEDAENDRLSWAWSVIGESTDRKTGGDAEAAPPAMPGLVVSQADGKVTLTPPDKPGAYRLFVIVSDGKGGASADNIPFRVSR
jgi:hypothetical protein